MNDFSLVDKLKILMNIIVSSPFFLFCFILGIVLLIFFIIYIKKGIIINKWILVSIWAILGIILVINYNSVLLHLIDDLINNIFMALYFPNFTIYLIILVISNFFFIYSIFNRKIKNSYRIINILNSLILNVFLIFIIDIVNKAGIVNYNNINIYTNSNLLVLLELSSAIFVSWILLNLLLTAYHRLQKYDKNEYPKMPEIIFDT